MMLGLPGSGKTTYSKKLQQELGITRLAVDEEYSMLGGDLSKTWDKEIALKAGTFIKIRTAELVAQNKSVILDLCPWIKSERDKYREHIESQGARCHIYYFEVDKQELLRRLAIRNESGNDYYIVSRKELDDFIQEFDAPYNEEVEVLKFY